MKQKLIQLKGEIDKSTIIVEDCIYKYEVNHN